MQRGLGVRIAEGVTRLLGSWRFLVVQSAIILTWVVLNRTGLLAADPYPFILLNLVLSLEAAYAAPLILMADRYNAWTLLHTEEQDYATVQQVLAEVRSLRTQTIRHELYLRRLLHAAGQSTRMPKEPA